MDERMNTVQRDPLALRRDDSVRQLMNALAELQEGINTAQMFWGTGKCMVDKKAAGDLIDDIIRLLPDAVKQASRITKEEQSIRENATREASEQASKSREDAQKIIDNAAREAQEKIAAAKQEAERISKANAEAANTASTKKAQAEKEADAIIQNARNSANAIWAQAQQEAHDYVERAKQQANMIIADANEQARSMISTDNTHRMAVMAANELREQTESEMAVMRHYYIEQSCNLMTNVENYLTELVTSIRNERQNLRNQQ